MKGLQRTIGYDQPVADQMTIIEVEVINNQEEATTMVDKTSLLNSLVLFQKFWTLLIDKEGGINICQHYICG